MYVSLSRILALGLVYLLVPSPSVADDLKPGAMPADAARFSMTVVDGGVMRLDGKTGTLSFCAKAADSFSCKAVADDRAAYLSEIEDMAKATATLKSQLAEAQSGIGRSGLPKDADIDRALSLMDRMMRHFIDRSFFRLIYVRILN